MKECKKLPLRDGFTTGTAATGAAMAALQFLATGCVPPEISVPLPPFHKEQARAWLTIPVQSCQAGFAPELDRAIISSLPTGSVAYASIIKDGGDDPDVTSGAQINATVVIHTDEEAKTVLQDTQAIRIDGGTGVGRVTLPGLPVPVGEAAINPVPRQQIRFGLKYFFQLLYPQTQNLPCMSVVISVPEGERLAKQTFNPRLGILGGISILGTEGIVRPFSHAAWKATICELLDVAEAADPSVIFYSTGRRSERLLRQLYPNYSVHSFIQIADFVEFALQQAGKRKFRQIIWGSFFGKLVKLAQGHACTHAHVSNLNLAQLAEECHNAHCLCAERVAVCRTAAEALDYLLTDAHGHEAIKSIVKKAEKTAIHFAGKPVKIHLFLFNGKELKANSI